MSERFIIGPMDPCTSTILLTKAEPSIPEDEEEPLDIGSWLTLYQGDGRPQTAIRCFEPKPKRARDIKKDDVILDKGSPGRVLEAPAPPDVDGKILIKLYGVFNDEATDYVTDDEKEITMCTASHTRYSVRNVPVAQLVPGTLVLQKQEDLVEENQERIFELPGGTVGPSLLPFFNTAEQNRMRVTLLIYEVMGRFQLMAFGIGNWDALG